MAPECYQCFTNCPIKEGNFSRCDFAKLSACAYARVACQANKIALNWIKTEHWLTCKKCAHQLSGASCSLIARQMIHHTIKYFSSFSKLTMLSKMQCNAASGHKTTAGDWNQGKIILQVWSGSHFFRRYLMSNDSNTPFRAWSYSCHSTLSDSQQFWKLKKRDLLYLTGKKKTTIFYFWVDLSHLFWAKKFRKGSLQQTHLALLAQKEMSAIAVSLHRCSLTCAITPSVPKTSSKHCLTKAAMHRKAEQQSFLQTALTYKRSFLPCKSWQSADEVRRKKGTQNSHFHPQIPLSKTNNSRKTCSKISLTFLLNSWGELSMWRGCTTSW